ncbi:MAG: farnesyl diphosphate synthase [Pseudomonadota bacterium]
MTFQDRLAESAGLVEGQLAQSLGLLPDSVLKSAMQYATLGGGKRLRAFLVLETAALFGISTADAMGAAEAIEAIHAYSLVHDDMPSMDDDDLRRGKPTVHKQWDEATAVLTGDALQSFAFERIAAAGALPADRKLALSGTLAEASGARGMALGQALDIEAETPGTPLSIGAITALQAGKTGALIEWAACAGPRMAGADIAPLKTYSRALGLAFQIADDILDVEGDEAKTGKRVGKDGDAGKATFVSLLGLDGAKGTARELVAEAVDALSLFSAQADYLRDAAQFVVSRDM